MTKMEYYMLEKKLMYLFVSVHLFFISRGRYTVKKISFLFKEELNNGQILIIDQRENRCKVQSVLK